jgi:hypothetical protein
MALRPVMLALLALLALHPVLLALLAVAANPAAVK